MVRETQLLRDSRRSLLRAVHIVTSAMLVCLVCASLLVVVGCSSRKSTLGTTTTVGANMAGPQMPVHLSAQAFGSVPARWELATPTSAVRSYLAWTSYALRTATSAVATPTMGPDEGVRVDSYVQYNLEKGRLLDQALTHITFGKPVISSAHTLVPTHEEWRYRYLSIAAGNRVVGGPYSVSYDATYTVTKTPRGWVVDSVKAKALGEVK